MNSELIFIIVNVRFFFTCMNECVLVCVFLCVYDVCVCVPNALIIVYIILYDVFDVCITLAVLY